MKKVRVRVRDGLGTSFMASILHVQRKNSVNDQSDVFKCLKLRDSREQHWWPSGSLARS